MKNKDIEKFSGIENEMLLFEREYNGFPYWQYIRFSVCESLFGDRHDIENKISGKLHVGFKKRLFFSMADIVKDLKLLLFSGRHELVVFRQTILKDNFFDSWDIPKNIRAYHFRVEEKLNEYRMADHYFGIPRIEKGLYRRFSRIIKKDNYDEKERDFLICLENRLKKQFGQSVSWSEMEEAIIDASLVHRFYKRYFKKIFEKLNCKAILTIVYYQGILYPAYEVAKEKGIKIIELQHGVINNHESYWFDDQRGINNYTPDYLLTFGDIHNKWIKLVGGSKAISVGFSYQESMIKKYENMTSRDDVVIFYPEAFSEYEKIIDQFIDKYKQYNTIIKLHPLQVGHVSEFFPLLSKNKNAMFIEEQDKSIYYWLKYARHHVMASTTVGLEAMAFEHCNVCIIESVPHDQTQCLLDWGVARGFKSVNELADLIHNPIGEKPYLKQIREQLWKKNAKNNIESFFRKISENSWEYTE